MLYPSSSRVLVVQKFAGLEEEEKSSKLKTSAL